MVENYKKHADSKTNFLELSVQSSSQKFAETLEKRCEICSKLTIKTPE